ncbi:unnamed protein product [Effrenium voratum]|uniref:Uncharacterized protein n=1 Tax=Effrenium voratum TaxID=2562239 RepID=A0AA36IJ99_9DINO|nr:unnamed protein product [Effrenium voratum]
MDDEDQRKLYRAFVDELANDPRTSWATKAPYLSLQIYSHTGLQIPAVRPLSLYTPPVTYTGANATAVLLNRRPVLFWNRRLLLNSLAKINGIPLTFQTVSDLPDKSYSNWLSHRAGLYFPYDWLQTMGFYDWINMGLPTFVPDTPMYTFTMLGTNDRGWLETIFQPPKSLYPYNYKDWEDLESRVYWWHITDFKALAGAGVQLFSSLPQLMELLQAPLAPLSAEMRREQLRRTYRTVLGMHRNLISAAWSHKEWDAGLIEHAKVLALFNDYLTKAFRQLDPSIWRWIAYEDLCGAWSAGHFEEVGQELGSFLGLPSSALSRAFRHFKPSQKDAAKEMSGANLRTLRELERCKGGSWFPELFGQQQLLKGLANGVPKAIPAVRDEEPEEEEAFPEISKENPSFVQLWDTLSLTQRQAWREVDAAMRSQDSTRLSVGLDRFNRMISEDQRFILQKAMLREKVGKRVDSADVDFQAFGCLHFWIEDRGFGSELNNLVSAAIACEENGLACVVEDEVWNSGRLHTYLQAEPLILRRCSQGCRPLEVRRNRRVATPGWFAVCKHAKGVSFKRKSEFLRRIWRYTGETAKRIERLNSELRLPEKYIAVQIRRGDKVAGNRKESLQVTGMDFASAALKHVTAECNVIAVCTDDLSAAEELGEVILGLSRSAEAGDERPRAGLAAKVAMTFPLVI